MMQQGMCNPVHFLLFFLDKKPTVSDFPSEIHVFGAMMSGRGAVSGCGADYSSMTILSGGCNGL